MGYLDYMVELLTVLKERSYKEGEFVLASGETSDFYIDCKATTLMPYGLSLSAHVILRFIQQELGFPDVLAAVPLGGCPLVDATAFLAHQCGVEIGILYVRPATKDHGTEQKVEGIQNMRPGARVVLIEDVVTTGNSAINAIKALRANGIEPVYVLALVDRLDGARANIAKHGVELRSIFTKDDFLKR
jgi:orotate phosphoribosyltransferase